MLVASLTLPAPRRAQAQCFAPGTSDNSSCGPGSIELAAYSLGAGTNVTHSWYTSPSGGNPLIEPVYQNTNGMAVVTTYTAYFSQTTTYYVSSYDSNTGCRSDRTPVTATVRPAAPFSVPDVVVCGSGRAALTAYETAPGSTVVWYDAAGAWAGTGQSLITPMLYNSTYYTAEVSVPGYCTARRTVQVTLRPGYSAPWVSPVAAVCPSQRASLTAGGAPEGSYYIWFNDEGTPRQAPSTSGTYTTDVLNTTTTFYVAYQLRTEPYCMSSCVPVQAVVHPLRAIPTSASTTYSFSDGDDFQVRASPGAGGTVCRWYTTPSGGSYAYQGNTYVPEMDCKLTKTFYAASYNTTTGCESSQRLAIHVTVGPLFCRNFVRTNVMNKAGITQDSRISPLSIGERQESVAYVDGLGRPSQEVITQGSPSRKDIVQPFAYDEMGRERYKYLPYTTGSNGFYKPEALDPLHYPNSEQYKFYQQAAAQAEGRAWDTAPRAETRFEASPLNRVLEQGAPGSAWQITDRTTPAHNKTLKLNQRSNRQVSLSTAAAGDDNVRLFTYAFNTSNPQLYGTLTSGQYYPAGELLVSQRADEKNYQSLEFKDKLGRVLLKKVQYQDPANPDAIPADTNCLLTYYIYDDLNQLRMVIQPEGSFKIPSSGPFSPQSFTDSFVAHYCFTYHYDKRGRLIEKSVPGGGVIWMVYNQRDQLILTQDAKQRPGRQWSFTKYDGLGRVVSSGLYVDPSATGRNQAQMQAAADLFSGQFESRTAANYNLGSAFSQWGYTINGSFPALNLATDQLLTLQFYDDYNFDNSADNSRDRNPILESYSIGNLEPDYRHHRQAYRHAGAQAGRYGSQPLSADGALLRQVRTGHPEPGRQPPGRQADQLLPLRLCR